MAANISKGQAVSPMISLVSIVVLGIIISQYLLDDESLELPIILFSFILGILVAAAELRVIVVRNREQQESTTRSKIQKEDVQDRLARFVADLFDEDIPFDDLEGESDEVDSETANDRE